MSSSSKLKYSSIVDLNNQVTDPPKAAASNLLKSLPKIHSAALEAEKVLDEERVKHF